MKIHNVGPWRGIYNSLLPNELGSTVAIFVLNTNKFTVSIISSVALRPSSSEQALQKPLWTMSSSTTAPWYTTPDQFIQRENIDHLSMRPLGRDKLQASNTETLKPIKGTLFVPMVDDDDDCDHFKGEEVDNDKDCYDSESLPKIPPRALGTIPSLPDQRRIPCTPENASPSAPSITYLSFGSYDSTTLLSSSQHTGSSSNTAKRATQTFKESDVEDIEKDFVLKYPFLSRTSSGCLMPRLG